MKGAKYAMNFGKVTTGKDIALISRTARSSLTKIDEMFNEAKKDFPSLERGHVDVERYKNGAFGIEFPKPKDAQVPDSYKQVERLPSRA